jgi:Na+-driven multidrug efflux pump
MLSALLISFLFSVLITRYGFYGAAWGQVVSYLIMSSITALFVFYKLHNKRKKAF